MTRFTLITSYYNNPEQLMRQWENFRGYNENWSWIIVDDGSQLAPLSTVLSLKIRGPIPDNITMYRIEEDIPWNNHGARNLAAYMAPYSWLFMTDMDGILPAEDANALTGRKVVVNRGSTRLDHLYMDNYYKPIRLEMPDKTLKPPHANTFLVHRCLHWTVGGYDEDYSGTYGGDHRYELSLQEAINTGHITLPETRILYYPRSIYTDSGTNNLERKGSPWHEEYQERRKDKNKFGFDRATTPLRFTWRKIG